VAIVSVKPVGDGRGCSIDEEGVRSYTLEFLVLTNSLSDGALTVRNAWTLPRIMDVYADHNGTLDTGARCKNISVASTENWWKWKVTCSFDTKPRSKEDADKQEDENPLNRPAKISFSSEARKIAAQEDVNGKAMLNTAGDPFDPPIEVTEYNLILEVEKNLPVFDPTVIVNYEGRVNENAFMGFERNRVLCKHISASSQEENGISFWAVKVTFAFHREDWSQPVLSQGTNQITAAAEKVSITDPKTKQAYTKPVPLDVNGRHITRAELLSGAKKPYFVPFQFHPFADFTALNLFPGATLPQF
jgi:hypothetical protein